MQLGPRFDEALAYASQLHATQRRKGSGAPYVAHLLGVTSIVLENGGIEDEAIGALLHDAVEDQGGAPRLDEIRERFGVAVADIVAGCTDADTTPKPPWRDRKEAYLAHLPNASRSVQLVSAADKLYNVRAVIEDYRVMGERVWDRFTGGREGTLWYYRAVIARLEKLQGTSLFNQLERAVAELESAAASGPKEALTYELVAVAESACYPAFQLARRGCMKVVYIAGPYRAPTEYGVLLNIQRAEQLALRVWMVGAACICPHKNTAFFGGAAHDNVWLNGDKEIIRRCDAVVCTEGWQGSVGAAGEVALARELGIPVFERFEDFENWLASSHESPQPAEESGA